MSRGLLRGLLCAAVLTVGSQTVRADDIAVFVGYADGLRGSGFFPSPWFGDPNTVFVGSTGSGLDAGAIRIDNNSHVPILINDVSVNLHPASQSNFFDLWGSNILLPGQKLILTQTAYYNFDTSDYPISPVGVPVVGGPNSPAVTVTVNGTPTTFLDTGHVLDTQGYDYAAVGNESFVWRPIGTSGLPSGAPEPSSLILAGMGMVGLVGFGYRRWKKAAI